ncbi:MULTISPECIES: NAD(P)-binding domain-containing protein [unclassified Cupriavidus]|uniref:NAD(P)-binding domain-containing protein n=1 Tax=unclassified Cupriavidus TaxID=2640874 RepID=UPI0003F7D135|nr:MULTISPECIES: NAD(P)-binding domain-containing protein [unclassified Cupriavidus]MBP0635733.1 NAD(P)-binding domain-containing protein [Cupriavidus sp. AcVe19-6a]
MISSTDTVIVGAGPYGLSVSAYLSKAGVPNQILGEPMHAWRNFMPPGMLLRSEPFASNLYAPWKGYTLEEYCRRNRVPYRQVGMRVPLELFVDYGLWFQSRLVSHVRPVDVIDMHRKEGLYRLLLSDGSAMAARRVVVALGLKGFAQVPAALQAMPKPYVVHSGEIGSLAWAKGKRIVVVGGGQSAIGLAALFGELGARVRLLVRGEVNWSRESRSSHGGVRRLLRGRIGLGRGWDSNSPSALLMSFLLSEHPAFFHMLDLQRRQRLLDTGWAPSGASWLRDRVEGKIDIRTQTEIRDAELRDGQVVLQVSTANKVSRISADHVVLATGFKIDLTRHSFLSQELQDSLSLVCGAPSLTRNFETNLRDLYVVGPAAALSFGPALRFVYGAKYAAPHLARHILGRFKQDADHHVQPPAVGPEPDKENSGSRLHGQTMLQVSGNKAK